MPVSYLDAIKLQKNQESRLTQKQIITFPLPKPNISTSCCIDHGDAIDKNHCECLQKMIKKYGTIFQRDATTNIYGSYNDACTYAIEKNNFKICKWLLDNKIFKKSASREELKTKFKEGYIPYYMRKNTSILEKSASPEIFELLKHLYDKTILDIDYEQKHNNNNVIWLVRLETVKHANDKYNKRISIYDAIEKGRFDLVQYCIQNNFEYDKNLCLEHAQNSLEKLEQEVNTDYKNIIVKTMTEQIIPLLTTL
jgi:hypothetical protein